MGALNFVSFRELRSSTGDIKTMLSGEGRIVVTNNGKPAAFMVAINESSFEDVLDDWRQVRGLRALRDLQCQAEQTGLTEMSLDDINAEIAQARKEHQVQVDKREAE